MKRNLLLLNRHWLEGSRLTEHTRTSNRLYRVAAGAALVALSANLLDVVIGFGEPDVVAPGTRTATEWFSVFSDSSLRGLYLLGILNVVYMLAMLVVYLGVVAVHGDEYRSGPAFILGIALTAAAIYIANNAAIPMFVLAGKYAGAAVADQPAFVSAGEAVLARGEDFTPGAFAGLALSGVAAIAMSAIMLAGGVFRRTIAWTGIAGFTLLLIFTIWATFIPVWYEVAFYGFGLAGGLLALVWFGRVARTFARLGEMPKRSDT